MDSVLADRARLERKFLHDLSSVVGSAILYAELIKESKSLNHIDALMQAHSEIEELIRRRRAELGGAPYEPQKV